MHDHPALAEAHRAAARIVPVFVLDPRILDAGRFPSANRAWFLLASLRELRAAPRERGGELYVRRGKPETVLPELVREVGAEAVCLASDVSPFAMARDRRVELALDGIDVRRRPGNFVADIGVPKTQDGRPFAVFSAFHRVWERVPRRAVHGAPRRLHVPPELDPGEIPAGPDPEAGGTSELSPYVHFGCLSAREVEARARAQCAGAFVRQLAWRDFYARPPAPSA